MTPPTLELITLGDLQLRGGTYRRPMGLTLLAYLLLEGTTSRSQLWSLFWPQAQHPAASLRVLLNTFRSGLPAGTLTTDQTQVSAQLPCDALQLLSAPTDPAVQYTGPFLQGVLLPPSAYELQEWVLTTRERLALAAQLQLMQQAEAARTTREVEQRLSQCLKLPGAAPLPPELLRRCLELAPPNGPAAQAVRYELRELDVALLPEAAPRSRPIIGREYELTRLLTWLQADVRGCELTGVGGIGKTSLLRALQREAAPLFQRSVLIDLDGVPSSAVAAGQIADALQVTLSGNTLPGVPEPWTALAAALPDAPVLLLLDSADEVSGLADGLRTLLQRSRVQVVLATQGIQLLQGAHLPLGGLVTAEPNGELSALQRSPGVQLFLQAAEQVIRMSSWSEAELRLIAAIVRRVDGHPLAIRLTALQLATLPLEQLYRQTLEDRLDTAPLEQLYHRALTRLSEHARLGLAQLATLPDLAVSDAAELTGLTSALMDELQRQSLLSVQDRRLRVQPALRRYARLIQPDDAVVRAAHAELFLGRLPVWAPAGAEAVREQINLTEALSTALEQRGGTVAQVDWLMVHFEQSGQLTAGLETLVRLAQVGVYAPAAVQAALQVARAWLSFRSARFQDAEGHARQLIGQVDEVTEDARMKGYNILSAVLMRQQGRMDEVVPVLQQAIALAQRRGDRVREVMYLGNLCSALTHLGQYGEARSVLAQAVQCRAGEPPGPEDASNRILDLGLRFDQEEPAEDIMQDAHALIQELPGLQAPWMASMVCLLLGRAALRAARLETAEEALKQARVHLAESPDPTLDIPVLLLTAEVQTHRLDTPAARATLLRAGRRCQELGEEVGLLEVLLQVAQDLRWHDLALSRQVARAVERSPAALATHRQQAKRLDANGAFGPEQSTWAWWQVVEAWYIQGPLIRGGYGN